MANKSVININGKDHVLTFGIGFLEKLNSKYTINSNGIEIAQGVNKALIEIQTGNVACMYDIIMFATATNRVKPTPEEVEDYLFSQLETEEQMAELVDSFFEIWKKLPGAAMMQKRLDGMKEPAEETPKKTVKK